MNTVIEAAGMDVAVKSNAPRTPPHATHKLKLLLRREFWEHKGGFFWAPIWAGGISLLLTLMALIMGEVAIRQHGSSGINLADGRMTLNGLDLNALTAQMSPAEMQKMTDAISMSTASVMIWPMLVLGFVVFFYCLGSLYDERKDRSVLFWKSLPVSDRDTVFSKALSALLVAPIMALAVGIVCMVVYLLILSAFVLLHHGNPFVLLWSPGNLLASAGVLLATIPLYALWALPSVGWLLLCSAWSRSKPFLWAIMLPVMAGLFVSWFDLMNVFNLGSGWFWKNVVAHLLGGVFPGSWISAMDMTAAGPMANAAIGTSINHMALLKAMYGVLATPQLLVGVAVGVAMIAAAIPLRRWRDEG